MTLPLISCIMPTACRGNFLAQAARLYHFQDYPSKELVTVEDGEECNWETLLGTNYHHIGTARHSIGYKRNLGSQLAYRGDLFCLWDDDDWYSSQRLSAQAAPILSGEADITALQMRLLYDASEGVLWECSEEVHKSLFPHNVKCGTLMYRASLWRSGVRYPDKSRGEDVAFLEAMVAQGARLKMVDAPGAYICIRHSGNTSADVDGRHLPGWKRVDAAQYFSEDDLTFYRQCAASTV